MVKLFKSSQTISFLSKMASNVSRSMNFKWSVAHLMKKNVAVLFVINLNFEQ